MIKFLIGDLFKSKATTLVNTVNCVGVMGKGIALEFKIRYPSMFKEYVSKCKQNLVKPGQPYYYNNLLGDSIINFPTKEDWRSMSKIEYIESGLEWFVNNYEALEIKKVAFPPLGCGNGGLLWEDVGPIVFNYLSPLPIDIEIYAPYGTKQEHLSYDFLSNEKGIKARIGIRQSKFNENWLCVLEVIRRLNQNKYVSCVGRTSYQKICYMLDYYKLDLGFKFSQANYGPFSIEAKNAFIQMSNSNLLCEKKIGNMQAIYITNQYDELMKSKQNVLNRNEQIVEKVTDLFCRIKNTAQAEIFTTILYSYLQMKTDETTEEDILTKVLNWKNHWVIKKEIIAHNIREMAMLGYINPQFSSALIAE